MAAAFHPNQIGDESKTLPKTNLVFYILDVFLDFLWFISIIYRTIICIFVSEPWFLYFSVSRSDRGLYDYLQKGRCGCGFPSKSKTRLKADNYAWKVQSDCLIGLKACRHIRHFYASNWRPLTSWLESQHHSKQIQKKPQVAVLYFSSSETKHQNIKSKSQVSTWAPCSLQNRKKRLEKDKWSH